ncbi:hypothetical protein D9615_009230 [Tricholomella constricta]|uniref:Uncharacterized protein n=1 Tax=Tricholomella constricta TaxID=117010 RepID=A0A8H5GWJ1_9AGAR|nr:hypothetical protein D9615_009230 [Tricholomella constricta]
MLPLELIYTIIDELAGDKPALSACSLASSSLREQAQKHLYTEVTLCLDGRDSSRADDLHEILYSHLQLASFVVSLKVPISQPFERESIIARQVTLLNRFPRVRSVVLTSARPKEAQWRTMQLNVRIALSTLIQQSTVETLTLDRQGSFPPQILSYCWQLKDLTVRRCLLQGSKKQPRTSSAIAQTNQSRQRGHLSESSRIYVASDFLREVLIQTSSSLSFSRLHTLDISDVKTQRIRAVQDILNAACLTLVELSLGINYIPSSPDPANPIISLRALTRLNSLALTSEASYHPGLTGRFLSIITSLPTTLCGVKTRITFTVYPAVAFPTAYPEEWRLLDTTLTAMHTAEVLAPLRVFLLSLDGRKQVSAALQRMLPDLDARGCLNIERRTRP